MYVILFSIGAENVYSSVWFFFSFTFFSFFWENASQSKHIQYLLFLDFLHNIFRPQNFQSPTLSSLVRMQVINQLSDKSARYSDDTFQKNVIQKSYG